MLTIQHGKGGKSRTVPLPESLTPDLQLHLKGVKKLYQIDLENDYNGVFVPGALEKKYKAELELWSYEIAPSTHTKLMPYGYKAPFTRKLFNE